MVIFLYPVFLRGFRFFSFIALLLLCCFFFVVERGKNLTRCKICSHASEICVLRVGKTEVIRGLDFPKYRGDKNLWKEIIWYGGRGIVWFVWVTFDLVL